MIEYRKKIGKIMVGCWLNGDRGNVILSPGIPQYISKYHPFLQLLADMGVNLFVPRYEGSWESEGVLTLCGCIRTIRKTVNLVRRGECKELYGNKKISWNKDNISIVGFSYGALPALLSEIDVKTILICPFIYTKYHLGDFEGEDIRHSLKFVERGYGEAYRFKSDKLIADLKNVKYPIKVNRRLILIRGEHDNAISKEELDEFIQMYNPIVFTSKTKHTIVVEKDILYKAFF